MNLTIEQLEQFVALKQDPAVSMNDIIFNDGCDQWGESGFTTRQIAEALITDWERDTKDADTDFSDLIDLLVPWDEIVTHESVAQLLAGEHFATGANQELLCQALDWTGRWPVIDAAGKLTGDVYTSDRSDADDFANVDDEAMIAISDLPLTEQKRIRLARQNDTWDGYAKLTIAK